MVGLILRWDFTENQMTKKLKILTKSDVVKEVMVRVKY